MIYIEYGLDFDYNPFGIGRSVEIENDDGTEYRTNKAPKLHNKSYYFRLWIGKKVLVISRKGFEIVKKNRKNIKIVFGIKGKYLKNNKKNTTLIVKQKNCMAQEKVEI